MLNLIKLLINFFKPKNLNELKSEETEVSDLKKLTEPIVEEPIMEESIKEETVKVENKKETIIEEQKVVKEPIKIKKHFLPKSSYFSGPTKKEWVFLHHTAGWENPYNVIAGWGRDTRNVIATEFLIGGQKITDNSDQFDGEIVQAFPEGSFAWHLGIGRRDLHTNSIGIELNSFGYLTRGGYHTRQEGKQVWIKKQPGKFYTYVGTLVNDDQVIELEQNFRGYKYWHKYSDKQINSLKQLIIYIKERDGIDPKKGLVELIKEKGAHEAFDFCDINTVNNTPGLWLHTNVQKGKFDLYPDPDLIKMLLSL
jgi:hypothetical protein